MRSPHEYASREARCLAHKFRFRMILRAVSCHRNPGALDRRQDTGQHTVEAQIVAVGGMSSGKSAHPIVQAVRDTCQACRHLKSEDRTSCLHTLDALQAKAMSSRETASPSNSTCANPLRSQLPFQTRGFTESIHALWQRAAMWCLTIGAATGTARTRPCCMRHSMRVRGPSSSLAWATSARPCCTSSVALLAGKPRFPAFSSCPGARAGRGD